MPLSEVRFLDAVDNRLWIWLMHAVEVGGDDDVLDTQELFEAAVRACEKDLGIDLAVKTAWGSTRKTVSVATRAIYNLPTTANFGFNCRKHQKPVCYKKYQYYRGWRFYRLLSDAEIGEVDLYPKRFVKPVLHLKYMNEAKELTRRHLGELKPLSIRELASEVGLELGLDGRGKQSVHLVQALKEEGWVGYRIEEDRGPSQYHRVWSPPQTAIERVNVVNPGTYSTGF